MSRRVQKQFGANAAAYATSKVHAQGASLERLLALTQPRPDWQLLDVATGAGHTAIAFAPFVDRVVGLDVTSPMLQVAAQLAVERGVPNATWVAGDAAALPWPAASFDLVTCRIAPHHFADVGRFVRAAVRVLKPGGLLAVVDNIVPGSTRRGKAARQARRAGAYVNAFEKLRDPSHGRCLAEAEWVSLFVEAGLALEARETLAKSLEFDDWTARMNVTSDNRLRLRAMLIQAPQAVADFLTPQFSGDRIKFRLSELIIVGRRLADAPKSP